MRIGLFLGGEQYGAAEFFLRALAQAWRGTGHQVVEIPATPVWEGVKAAVKARVEVVFAYNAFGSHLRLGNQPIYSRMHARFASWLVDHPVYHTDRLTALPGDSLVACVDPTHLDYLPSIDERLKPALWLPHFGCAAERPPSSRDIAVFMPGTVLNEDDIRARWQQTASARLTESLVEEALARDEIVWHELLTHVAPKGGERPSAELLHTAVRQADRFIRAWRRRQSIASLSRAGVKATISGAIHAGVHEVDAHDVRGPLPIATVLDLMARSHIVIDPGAAFPAGSHERGLCAMANGALALVEHNRFWDRFADDEVQRFAWREVKQLGADVCELLSDPADVRARGERARAAIARGHTAAHRAAAFIDAVAAQA